ELQGGTRLRPCPGRLRQPSVRNRNAVSSRPPSGRDRRRSPRSVTSPKPPGDRAWHTAARRSRGCAEPDEPTIGARRAAPCAADGGGESSQIMAAPHCLAPLLPIDVLQDQ